MKYFIGDIDDEVKFFEALFSNVPSKFMIFYDADMDIKSSPAYEFFKFESTATLIDVAVVGVNKFTLNVGKNRI
jgi:hypothetical protein